MGRPLNREEALVQVRAEVLNAPHRHSAAAGAAASAPYLAAAAPPHVAAAVGTAVAGATGGAAASELIRDRAVHRTTDTSI
jgi:hypothetical protein